MIKYYSSDKMKIILSLVYVVYMCLCMFVCVSVHVWTCVEVRDWCWMSFSIFLHLAHRDMVLHLNPELPSPVAFLASLSQGPIISTSQALWLQVHFQFSNWLWGGEVQGNSQVSKFCSTHLYGKNFIHWALFPVNVTWF